MAVCARYFDGAAPRRSFLCHNALEGRIVTKRNAIGIRPEHIRFAVGYGSVSAWGVMMLYVPWAASPGFSLQALLSMVPGLVVCLACLLLFTQHLSLSGRTPLVAGAALLTSLGTLACTYPTLAAIPGAFVTGMALSGGFAILLIMAWFDAFAHIGPRGIIVLSGCSIVDEAPTIAKLLGFDMPSADGKPLCELLEE